MEIKDVNNNGLLSLLQSNKSVLAGDVAGVGGFGDLLAGLENSSVEKKMPEFTERKEAAGTNFSKPIAKEKQSVIGKRDDAGHKKSVSNAAERAEKNSRPENKKQRTDDSSKKFGGDTRGENAVKAEGKTENLSASRPVEETSTIETGEDITDVREVSLDVLALMGIVTVANPVSGEMMQVSGAELAAQLQAAGIESVELVSAQDGVQVLPLFENTAQVEDFQNILREMQPVAAEVVDAASVEKVVPAVKAVKDINSAETQAADDVSVVEAQAAELEDVVGSERKVKVEVNVKAEKIAELVDKNLAASRPVVNENVLISGEADASNPLLDGDAASQVSVNAHDASQIKNAVLTSTAAGSMAAAVSADTAATVVSDGSSVSAVSAGAVGNEMLSNARLAPANDGSTSFRDVYKGMGREVVEQIKVNITKSAVKGVDTIEIQLKPEDLGKIEVKMQIGKDGKLQAHIVSSRPETAEILQKEMSNLQKAFEDAGFQTDENSLNFSFRDDGQAGREQERNSLRSFIGNVLEQETMADAAGNDTYAGTAWDGNGGLNIRV